MDYPGEKLVVKLWETVAEKGIGNLFKPWQMRREGRATIEMKREELLTIAQAEQDADRIRRGEILVTGMPLRLLAADTPASSIERCTSREERIAIAASGVAAADTMRKEANITRALLQAEEALESDPQEPPPSAVSDDWLFRWRDSASQVSSEELQNLWGRVLAGEVKAPGTYSLRTLEFIRNLSQEEAQAISKLSQFVIEDFIFRNAKDLLEKHGINFGFLLYMQQLGVISGVEAIGLEVTLPSMDQAKYVRVLRCNSMVLVATADDQTHTVKLPVYQVSPIGKQVLTLGRFEPHLEYLKSVAEHLKPQGVGVELAHYITVSSSEIRYFNGTKL